MYVCNGWLFLYAQEGFLSALVQSFPTICLFLLLIYNIHVVVLPVHQLLELMFTQNLDCLCCIQYNHVTQQYKSSGIYTLKSPQKRSHNSLLAAYPLLSIFSVVMTPFGIGYRSSIGRQLVKDRAFSPTPAKCACISPSPVHLRTRISSIVPRELCLHTADLEIIGIDW